jgi:hypothetical protein
MTPIQGADNILFGGRWRAAAEDADASGAAIRAARGPWCSKVDHLTSNPNLLDVLRCVSHWEGYIQGASVREE